MHNEIILCTEIEARHNKREISYYYKDLFPLNYVAITFSLDPPHDFIYL